MNYASVTEIPDNGKLPLKGFVRLYEANLRAERKSDKTIQAYGYVLEKFGQWFAAEHGHPPVLAEFAATPVRFFLGAIQTKRKWDDHPYLRGVVDAEVSGATLHMYTRTLKTFGG